MSNWKLLEKSTGELEVTLSGEKWTKAQEIAFDKLAKNVEIDGFRKGQAPKNLVKNKVSEAAILEEAVNSIANELLREGVEEHSLVLVARPELRVDAISKEELKATFICTIKPEVELGEYKGLEYNVEKYEATEEEVSQEIERLQKQYAEIVDKDGAAENGDTVVIDFEGFKDGEAFEGGKAEGHQLKLGSKTFIPGFEEQLVGTKANDEVEVNVTFPEDYPAENLKGAEAVFKVKVHGVKSEKLPILDDEFAKDLNIKEVETLEQLKTKLKKDIEANRNAQLENEALDKLVKNASENAKIDIPEVMIDEEVQHMLQEFSQRLQMNNLALEQFLQMTNQTIEQLKEQMREEGTQRIRTRLTLEAIAIKEKVEIEKERIEEEFKKIADMYKMEVEKVKSLISEESLKADLKIQKAVELLKEFTKK